MPTHLLKKMFFVVLLALGAMLVSCSSNSADNNPAVKAGNYLQIRMHDFPIQDQDVEKVIVEIRKIEVHNSESGWMTVSETAKKYDLLELQNGRTAIVLDSPLPIGTYTQIRLELSQDNEVVVNGLPYPLKVPSGTESGIKLITPFDIKEGKMVEVTLDFDAQQSVNYTKGDGFHLKPVIKVEKIAEYDAAGLITPEGGNVTTLDGVLNIQIPAGAVSQSIIVTAEKADITGLPAPDATSQSVGIAYDLGPDGQTFNSPVLLLFHYHEEDLAGKGPEENLVLYRYDETTAAWTEVPSTVLASEDTVQAWVNHFCLYVLFIRPWAGVSGEFNIVGDSIAAGYASYVDVFSFPPKPKIDMVHWGYLAFYLKSAAPGIVLTGNFQNYFGLYTDAIGGDTSGDIKNRLGSIKDADNYILLVGTNDVSAFKGYVSADTYAQNMTDIINNFLQRRPNTRVYICTILPRSDNFYYNFAITAFNQRLTQIVQGFADLGKPVKLIDTCSFYFLYYYTYYTMFGGEIANAFFLADGLHPTIYGHSILATYIVQHLN